MSPNVLPRFKAVPCVYRGEPVAVLAACDAEVVDSAPGAHQVRVQRRTVAALAEQYGFREIDRFLSHAPQLLGSASVLYGPAGFGFEAHLSGVNIVEAEVPSSEWLELVESRGQVLAVLAAQRDISDVDLRTLTSSRRAFGAYVTAIRSGIQNSRYKFLDTADIVEIAPTHKYVFLDSNVLVHLEKVARGTSRDTARDTHVQALAAQISHQAIIGAFAVAELSWNREADQWDEERAESLRATVDAWFGTGSVTRARNLEDVRTAYRTALGTPRPLDSDHQRPREQQLAFYICLLKLSSLWHEASTKFSAVQRVALFEKFARWLMEDFGYNLGFALRIAFDRLVGPQDGAHIAYVNQLMKFGKNPLQELWGAAWDLTHLANIDLSVDPLFRQAIGTREGGVVLVTDDKALPRFRRRLSVRVVVRAGDYSLLMMASTTELDKRLRDQQDRVDAVQKWVSERTLERRVGYRSLNDWEELRVLSEADFLNSLDAEKSDGHSEPTCGDRRYVWKPLWRRLFGSHTQG
jgi:hypothetical protein